MCNFNDSNSSKPGKTGESLSEDDNVIRLGLEQSNYDRIGANHFRLSSKEKNKIGKEYLFGKPLLRVLMRLGQY